MILAKISEVEPADRVTTILTGFEGQFCAWREVKNKARKNSEQYAKRLNDGLSPIDFEKYNIVLPI